jgi:hypothetical protein
VGGLLLHGNLIDGLSGQEQSCQRYATDLKQQNESGRQEVKIDQDILQ